MTNTARGVIAGHHLRRIPEHRERRTPRRRQKRVEHLTAPNPSGICQCGHCGEKAPIARQSDAERGWVIGEPVPFVHNHHGKAAVQYIVEDRGCPLGPCWIWQLTIDKNGYGRTSVDGRPRSAHRVSCERAHGPIPAGYDVDHLCHVRPCVNPDHLEAVPPIVNQRRKTNVKLTIEIARDIRLSSKDANSLALELGVCATTIRGIRNNKSWVETANSTHAQVIDS